MDWDGRFILMAAALGFVAELGLGASTEALHDLWIRLSAPTPAEVTR